MRQTPRAQTELVKINVKRAAPLVGLVFSGVGLLPLLTALGVIPVRLGSLHCPTAVLAAVGVTFILAGLSIFFRGMGLDQKAAVSKVLGFLTVSCFMTPFVWLIFFNGTTPMLIRVVLSMFFCLMAVFMVLGKVLPKSFNIGEHVHIETKKL